MLDSSIVSAWSDPFGLHEARHYYRLESGRLEVWDGPLGLWTRDFELPAPVRAAILERLALLAMREASRGKE